MGAQVYLINQHQVDLDGCESWTIKKAERRRIDAFKVWYWRRFFIESLGLQRDPTSPS